MPKTVSLKTVLMLGCAFAEVAVCWPAAAQDFSVSAGDLKRALDVYRAQAGIPLVVSSEAVKGVQSSGAKGDLSPDGALSHILSGTGFTAHRDPSGIVAVVRENKSSLDVQPIQIAQAAPPHAAVETVTVTSSKLGGADVQSIPIAITALSQEQLTASQTNGGPDLIKQVPNMTFTKTNFSGYSIQLRGIGTQAISVTTDPAVAVAMNDIPFIRNHFFEQEFYDVGQVEVLRGPQGTLYGRNATAGVVNLTSAKPTDQFEATASGEIGNYHQRRLEGMANIPIVDDRLDIRLAGEWTKRQGFSLNETDSNRIDGRDLWSSRLTVGFKPTENLQTYLVWEHFSENDDRLRSAKQLCKTDPGGPTIEGYYKPPRFPSLFVGPQTGGELFSQGCKPESLYSPESFEAPLDFSLPYLAGLANLNKASGVRPYASEFQSHNLRVIESSIDPIYKANNDVVEFNADYALSSALTLTSQTGFSRDSLYSAEDYNRFASAPGFFRPSGPTDEGGAGGGLISPDGVFCDPQLGCSDRVILEDLSQEHAWQLSQEFRLASSFSGPFNFSVGGNYLHYETEENYYVFGNVFTAITANASTAHPWIPGVSDNSFTLTRYCGGCLYQNNVPPTAFQYNDSTVPPNIATGYIDPNPLSEINGNGHNYFRSTNPYVLNSYAAFGEAYYSILSNLKLTAGLRWTEDQKHFPMIPSWLVESGWGYPVAGVVDQQWDQFTGRAVANWTPRLAFTDQTLIYGSYSHGYKAGGANPPGDVTPIKSATGGLAQAAHPLTFKPEFIDAFELGTKNTLLDGALTLNGDLFYYNYENYQISEIVDRTAINQNFDAHVKGAEVEATWEPLPGLRFNLSGGWEQTAIAKGQSAIDLMDRTAGTPGWYVVKPYINQSSNCIFPASVAKFIFGEGQGYTLTGYCTDAYVFGFDPITRKPYTPYPVITDAVQATVIPAGAYAGFDPSTAPNDGQGFAKDLAGNSLPNAPPWTLSFGAQYSVPLSSDWAGTLRADLYWQDASWWRVFNDMSYDKLHAYSTVNLTLILTNQAGWQVMLYDKNVFNTTAITGAFLNSDDSGLTTNVFLTDPKLIGIRVTKNW